MSRHKFKGTIFWCLVIIISTTFTVFVSASVPNNLTDTRPLTDYLDSASHTQVVSAIDSNGNIHFVFVKYLHLFYKMDAPDGQTLIDQTQITNAGIHKISHPDMVIDEDDRVHIVWADHSGQHKIMYTVLNPYSPSIGLDGGIADDFSLSIIDDSIVSQDPNDRDSPAIALDSTGNVHIVWMDGYDELDLYRNQQLYYSMIQPDIYSDGSGTALKKIGNTLLTTSLSQKGNPDIEIDANDKVNIVWDDSSNSEVEFTFIIDTSGSMYNEWANTCALIYGGIYDNGAPALDLKSILSDSKITFYETLYAISTPWSMPSSVSSGECQNHNNLTESPEVRTIPLDRNNNDDSGGIRLLPDAVYDNASYMGDAGESWGPSTNWACLSWYDGISSPGNPPTSQDHKWNERATKFVIPISDEHPYNGDDGSSSSENTQTINEAHDSCVNAGIIPVALFANGGGWGNNMQHYMLDLVQCPDGSYGLTPRNCPGNTTRLTDAGGVTAEFPSDTNFMLSLEELMIYWATSGSREIMMKKIDPYNFINSTDYIFGAPAHETINQEYYSERIGNFISVNDTLLTNDPGDSSNPSIDFDNNDNLHVTWMDSRDHEYSRNSKTEIYHASFNVTSTRTDGVPEGLNLSQITIGNISLISNLESGNVNATSSYPSLLVTNNNKVHISWLDYANSSAGTEIGYVELDLLNSQINSVFTVEHVSTWNSTKSTNYAPTISGDSSSVYIAWSDKNYCSEVPNNNVYTLCYVQLAGKQLELALRGNESSNHIIEPGGNTSFDLWFNNTTPGNSSVVADDAMFSITNLPLNWFIELRYSLNNTVVPNGSSVYVEGGQSISLVLDIDAPSIYQAILNETVLITISATSIEYPSVSTEIELEVLMVVKRELEINSVNTSYDVIQGDEIRIPITLKSKSNVAEIFKFYDPDLNSDEWQKPEGWIITFTNNVSLLPEQTKLKDLKINIPDSHEPSIIVIKIIGWSQEGGIEKYFQYEIIINVIWRLEGHIELETQEEISDIYMEPGDCSNIIFRATKNYGSGNLYFRVGGAYASNQITDAMKQNNWYYTIDNSSADLDIMGGLWTHEHRVAGEWINVEICAPRGQIDTDYTSIELEAYVYEETEVNSSLELIFTRYQSSEWIINSPTENQNVGSNLILIEGELIENKFTGDVKVEVSIEISALYVPDENKDSIQLLQMYDSITLINPGDFYLTLNISSRIIEEVASNVTIHILVSDSKSDILSSISFQYSPDSDNDSVPNIEDDFPYDGTQWSDFDGDGFGDNWGNNSWNSTRLPTWPGDFIEGAELSDHCPLEAGNSTKDGFFGCPDDDGDGIANIYDQIVNEEKIDNDLIDSDGDGIVDILDQCMNTVKNKNVDSFGCELKESENYIQKLLSGEQETVVTTVGLGAIIIALFGFLQSNLAAAILPDTIRGVRALGKKSKLSKEERQELTYLQSLVRAYHDDKFTLDEELNEYKSELNAKYTNNEIKKSTLEKIRTLISEILEMNQEEIERIGNNETYFGLIGSTNIKERKSDLNQKIALKEIDVDISSNSEKIYNKNTPPISVKGQININDGYEYLEWPISSGRWFIRNTKNNEWNEWKD